MISLRGSSGGVASIFGHPDKQRGAVLVVAAVSMLAVLGMAGLTLDSGNVYVNNTRLQNLVDSAALSGAYTLNDTDGDTAAATTAAMNTFNTNIATGDYAQQQSINGGQVAIAFSDTAVPFVGGGADPRFIRVTVNGFTLPGTFSRVVGVNQLPLGASAVAGPSPQLGIVCPAFPVIVCGDESDTDPSNGSLFGYNFGQSVQIKSGSPGDGDIGPGNFQLARLGDSTGGADIRRNLAGDYNACINTSDSTIDTEPGNTVGPVYQGINTRFGIYQGPLGSSEYPPDVVVDAGGSGYPDTYAAYAPEAADPSHINHNTAGAPDRRVVAIPVAKCDGNANGQSTLPLLGTMCMFLSEPASHQGSTQFIQAEFLGDGCLKGGVPGPNPGIGPGPKTIQLYEDDSTNDS